MLASVDLLVCTCPFLSHKLPVLLAFIVTNEESW